MGICQEVLGIWFKTNTMTWCLPLSKLVSLVNLLVEANTPGALLSLHTAEVIHGKLVNFTQHARPLSFLVAEILVFLRVLLEENSGHLTSRAARAAKKFTVPPSMCHDLKTLIVIIKDTQSHPLPILGPEPLPATNAVKVFTDVSGHLLANPSLGINVQKQLHYERPLVASLLIPRSFLNKVDSPGHKAYCKTTALEALGFLAVLCLDPLRFAEKEIRR